MKKICLFLILVLFAGKVEAQNIESMNFDSQYGEYVIKYTNEDSEEQTAYYVPGNQAKPEVNTNVEYESAENLYSFSYNVTNKREAKVGLYSFSIEVKDSVQNANNPNRTWFTGMYDSLSAYDWADRGGKKEVGIQPGESETFYFQSKGLPTVVNAYASSLTGLFFSEEQEKEEPPYPIQVVVDSLKDVTNYVVIETIGPRKIPSGVTNEALLDSLRSYQNFSCDTTWVPNQGICRSLETKLENVERQLVRGNTSAASGSLEAFINEVEAQKDKQLSSEAYALLYFNGQYLLEQLINNSGR